MHKKYNLYSIFIPEYHLTTTVLEIQSGKIEQFALKVRYDNRIPISPIVFELLYNYNNRLFLFNRLYMASLSTNHY